MEKSKFSAGCPTGQGYICTLICVVIPSKSFSLGCLKKILCLLSHVGKCSGKMKKTKTILKLSQTKIWKFLKMNLNPMSVCVYLCVCVTDISRTADQMCHYHICTFRKYRFSFPQLPKHRNTFSSHLM